MHQAKLIQTIAFAGFSADELYPADLDGDGQLELLALQSPGIYQSAVFANTRWRAEPWQREISCLTAFNTRGEVLWQHGRPYPGYDYPSHVADQMLCCGDFAGRGREIALLQGSTLTLLGAANGEPRARASLEQDNYAIVAPWQRDGACRLVVKNTEAAYPGFWYGDPAWVFDSDLKPLFCLPRTVGSGHSVRSFDVNGDGRAELLIGYEAFDWDGRRLWRLQGQDPAGYDPILHHEDQIQIGSLRADQPPRLIYAGSRDFYVGGLDGGLLHGVGLGHPQHVLPGRYAGGGREAALAVLNLQPGPALTQWAQRNGYRLPEEAPANGIVWLDAQGQIISVHYPPNYWPTHAPVDGGGQDKNWRGGPGRGGVHSGEGILIYPHGCADGSDAVLVRDAGWPRAYDLAGEEPFTIPWPEGPGDRAAGQRVGPDGYGIRVADFNGDGIAQILVHDRGKAWIFQPPFPSVAPRRHRPLQPRTGQGWYAL